MHRSIAICIGLLTSVLAACQPAAPASPEVAPDSAATSPPPAAPAAQQVLEPAQPTATLDPAVAFPLSQPGPFFPGKLRPVLEGAKRDGSDLPITVWYPAIKPEGFAGTVAAKAAPDLTQAPYPLLIGPTIFLELFGPHLASHGFVAAGVDIQGPSEQWGPWLVDYPLETLAMLDRLAAGAVSDLEGAIDAENTGALGYSFSGYSTLALSGARVDPVYYQGQCASPPELSGSPTENVYTQRVFDYFCVIASDWQSFAEQAGDSLTQSEDGLWQPMTDPRIRAVMPMALEGAWLFGERGLASVDRPVLIIVGSEDSSETDYEDQSIWVFEHMGTSDRALIAFLGQNHLMVFDQDPAARMRHFITAFFGHQLQGRQEYAGYYSPEFVSRFADLEWFGPPTD
jgi:predicted dienelactone hydrolase